MKILVLLLCLSLIVIPVAATEVTRPLPGLSSDDPAVFVSVSDTFEGFQYIVVDSSLGEIRLYFPDGVSSSSFVVSKGALINMSNTTIYLYCPEYPDYTFSAGRFSPLSYRGDNYNSTVLTGVSLLDQSYSVDDFTDTIVIFLLLFIAFVLVWKGRK